MISISCKDFETKKCPACEYNRLGKPDFKFDCLITIFIKDLELNDDPLEFIRFWIKMEYAIPYLKKALEIQKPEYLCSLEKILILL